MANDLNRCEFIGNLGAAPEVRYTAAGTSVSNFSIACNREQKDASGQKTQTTEWIRLVAFGRLSDVCSTWLSKGDKIYAAGRQQTRSWQGQDGNKRYMTEVVINEMQMLDGKPSGGQGQAPRSEQPGGDTQAGDYRPVSTGGSQAPAAGRASIDDDLDDDIPF